MRPKAERKSLFVPVMSAPGLSGCWSVNLSDLGMGLVARELAKTDPPHEGEMLKLDFPLPEGTRVRVSAVVRWRHDGEGTTSLGVRFEKFDGDAQVELRRFLAAHRLRVVVAGAARGLQ